MERKMKREKETKERKPKKWREEKGSIGSDVKESEVKGKE
jgi:hypothetical protein